MADERRAASYGSRKAIVGWCLYDWANSPYVAVITTFVIAAYFTGAVAQDAVQGTAEWGFMMGLSALAVAVVAPVLGAIADRGGGRKIWLAIFTAIVALGSASLWWATPEAGSVTLVLWSVGIATAAFELGMMFYNAMLPGLVPERRLGRISGWAWALGYAGGLVCLIGLLFLFVQAETPLFGLDKDSAEHVRVVGPVVAVWTVLFSIPIFLWTPEAPGGGMKLGAAVGAGLRQLRRTIQEVRRYRQIARFLIARMLYMDGINTIFVFGGIYAVGTFGMAVSEVAIFGILLNVTAGLGALGFAWMDDRMGAKPTILVGIVGIVLAGIPLLLTESTLWFYILGGVIGVFFGPVQAASRSLMARMAPAGMETEMFGLYAFSGRATSFIGPWLVGVVALTAGQRWALAIVLPIIVAGGALMFFVDTSRADPDTVL
jgi:UMF1 family MFS transporter